MGIGQSGGHRHSQWDAASRGTGKEKGDREIEPLTTQSQNRQGSDKEGTTAG